MTHTDPQMLKGLLGLLLLRLVADRDDYGYSLVVRLRTAGLEDITEGTVYPALARCERAAWLTAYLVPSASGPARKYYGISSDGEVELVRALESWNHLVGLVGDLTSKESPQ